MYPDAVNLPFNRHAVEGLFVPAPAADDDGAPGYVVFLQGSGMIVPARDGLEELYRGEMPAWAGGEGVTIGTWRGEPLRTVRVPRDAAVPESFLPEEFNAAGDRLSDAILTIGGIASHLLHWQRVSRFCSLCASETVPVAGTWGRRCVLCGREAFPHIHPCAIVLVQRGDEVLLVRKPEWAPGRYGLVAGFLDVGEALEECVVREVREETGIEVTNVRYLGSQAWPFPSQLMAGFVADYAGGDIAVDHTELEDAQWFCRDRMPPSLPGRRSIARWIIDRWRNQ